jgi:hypothetical protein
MRRNCGARGQKTAALADQKKEKPPSVAAHLDRDLSGFRLDPSASAVAFKAPPRRAQRRYPAADRGIRSFRNPEASMTLEEYKRWRFIPEDTDLALLEVVARAMIASYNDVNDQHLRPLTYEDVLTDPRHGIIHAAAAAIKAVRDFDVAKASPPAP